MLEDCIIFLIWVDRVLFNFHLKQKQSFSVWTFTENAYYISFHGRIWARYSGVKKKIFPKIIKTHKKFRFQRQFQIYGGFLLLWIFIVSQHTVIAETK